jgi:outer membrane beta-barrel protein
MRTTARLSTICTCLVLVLLSSVSLAQERKSPLEGQPAIRHRYEMRKNRFELGPSFAFSINRALRQAIMLGLRVEYHILDWLSVGADFGYGVGLDTGLTKELEERCEGTCYGPASDPSNPDDIKAWDVHTERFSDLRLVGDVRLIFTPISGKLGVFSKLFMGYDLYAFVGFGMALLANKYDGGNDDKASQGLRVGPAWGVGMHLFFTKFFALGAEIKDIAFSDNESGGDLTRGLSDDEKAAGKILIDGDDKSFSNHWFAGVTFTFFLPAKVKMSP